MTITVIPHNEQEQNVLKAFLESLNYEYVKDDCDETTYLKSSSAMKEWINKSIKEEQEGKLTNINPDSILL